MLQIELTVNGCLIDFISIVNVSKQLKDNKSIYEVTYKGKKFGFTHIRPEGAVVCAMKALQAIIDENPAMPEQEIIEAILEKGEVDEKNCLVKSLEERKGSISFAPISYGSPSDEKKEVGYYDTEEPHPMLCVRHLGSPVGEEINKKYGFVCPKCKEYEEDANI